MWDAHKQDGRDAFLCETRPLYSTQSYRYTVIFARYRGKWIFCRHKNRDTWETAGGHIEPAESPLDCAKRELWEETGATRFIITPIFDYRAGDDLGEADSMTFYADVEQLGELPPEFEMKEIGFFDGLPARLTYPYITPILYRELTKQFCVGFGSGL